MCLVTHLYDINILAYEINVTLIHWCCIQSRTHFFVPTISCHGVNCWIFRHTEDLPAPLVCSFVFKSVSGCGGKTPERELGDLTELKLERFLWWEQCLLRPWGAWLYVCLYLGCIVNHWSQPSTEIYPMHFDWAAGEVYACCDIEVGPYLFVLWHSICTSKCGRYYPTCSVASGGFLTFHIYFCYNLEQSDNKKK